MWVAIGIGVLVALGLGIVRRFLETPEQRQERRELSGAYEDISKAMKKSSKEYGKKK